MTECKLFGLKYEVFIKEAFDALGNDVEAHIQLIWLTEYSPSAVESSLQGRLKGLIEPWQSLVADCGGLQGYCEQLKAYKGRIASTT